MTRAAPSLAAEAFRAWPTIFFVFADYRGA